MRPVYSALVSERAVLLPPLADALERYAGLRPPCQRTVDVTSRQWDSVTPVARLG